MGERLEVNNMRRRAAKLSARGRSTERQYFAAILLFLLSIIVSPSIGFSEDESQLTEPKLLSVFPWGGQRGTTIKAEIRGNRLEGAYGVWFDSGNFKAQVIKVEEVARDNTRLPAGMEQPEKPLPVYGAVVEIQIGATTSVGIYSLRLISPKGVSNALRFPVLDQLALTETPNPHQRVENAQTVSLPAIVNGKLDKPGELDYYSFFAKKGEELQFEVMPGGDLGKLADGTVSRKFDPQVTLYKQGGSWFDARRPIELLFQEERLSDLIPVEAGGTYQFGEDGQYFLEVSGLYGAGCFDCNYQLRIVPPRMSSELKAQIKLIDAEWTERSFDRRLEGDWMGGLVARAVPLKDQLVAAQKSDASAGVGRTFPGSGDPRETAPVLRSAIHPPVILDREPNDRAAQAPPVSMPVVIEGALERPGDIDSFTFTAKQGEKLAFEIQAQDAQPPQFNPRFAIVDSQDRELFSNVHKAISLFNANADKHTYLRGVAPKAIYTFEKGGNYVLQVRDFTSRYGGPSFRYRILIRPQIPHIGGISVAEADHINLVRGEAKKLTITSSYEEGFSGQVAFTFAGLPEGVQVLPGAELNDEKAPSDVDETPDIVAPKRQKTTIVLLAGSDAQASSVPKLVRLNFRPISNGKLGEISHVRDIPLMVVEGAQQ